MSSIDRNSIKIKLATSKYCTDKMISALEPRAKNILNKAKNTLLSDFEEHSVTQEILGGPLSSNISNTLPNVTNGNLWGFLGFPQGSKPVQNFEAFLKEEIYLKDRIQGRDNKGRFESGGTKLTFDFFINYPSREEVTEVTPLYFESTKSWVYGIEDGVAGFNSYLAFKLGGRSQGGFQANDGKGRNGRFNGGGNSIQVRPGQFRTVPYFTQMMDEFKRNFL